MLEMIWAFIKGDRHIYIPIGTGVLGLVIGYILWGLLFNPAPTNVNPSALSAQNQDVFLRSVAAAYAVNPQFEGFARFALEEFDNPAQALCSAINVANNPEGNSYDPAIGQSLSSMLPLLPPGANGDCSQVAEPEESGGIFSLWNCGLGLLLLALAGAGFYLLQQRRNSEMDDYDIESMTSRRPTEVPTDMPTLSTDSEGGETAEASNITAIASYRTTFVRGYDAYDDSFSIENVNGDFLGECGVGISESIGTDSPKSVTALEVWLFDKNDIRTITKVAMSDHAFFDDAIKAKLAPKGEPILAREEEVVVLETASLIINAKITELVYGDNPELPEKSYFEKFSIEISAWAQGDAVTSGGGGDDFGF